jgi:hypothetical protein
VKPPGQHLTCSASANSYRNVDIDRPKVQKEHSLVALDASTFHVYFSKNFKEPSTVEFFSSMIGYGVVPRNEHSFGRPSTLMSGLFSPSQLPHEPENEISALLST